MGLFLWGPYGAEQPIPSKHGCSYFLSNCLPGSKNTGRKFPLGSTAALQLQVAQFLRVCSLISFFVCFYDAGDSHVGPLPPLLIWLQSVCSLAVLLEVSLTHSCPHLTGLQIPVTSSQVPALSLHLPSDIRSTTMSTAMGGGFIACLDGSK